MEGGTSKHTNIKNIQQLLDHLNASEARDVEHASSRVVELCMCDVCMCVCVRFVMDGSYLYSAVWN